MTRELLAALACVACTASPSARRPDASRSRSCGERDPSGSVTELRTPVAAAEGVWIDAPEFCNVGGGYEGGAYIRVHGRGVRRLVRFRGCKSAQNRDECPEIDLDAFALVVSDAVRGISPTAGGAGVGICSDLFAPRAAWRGRLDFSTSITRWQDADAAIRIVHGLLDAWDIADSYGISVRALLCVVEE